MHEAKLTVVDRIQHEEDPQPILRFRAYNSKCEAFGPTAAVAICRCFVLSKLGAELRVPEMVVKAPVFVDPKDCANPKVVHK